MSSATSRKTDDRKTDILTPQSCDTDLPRASFSCWPSRASTDATPGGFATQLQCHLDTELRLLHQRDPWPGQQAVLRVHRETLRLFASKFRDYGGVLQRIVREYDKVLEIVDTYEGGTQRLRDQVESLRKEAAARSEEQGRLHELEVSRMRRQIDRLRQDLLLAREQSSEKETQVTLMAERVSNAEREVEEGHLRNMLVTNALRESSERQHKALAEIKRLTDLNRDLRRIADTAGDVLASNKEGGARRAPGGGDVAFMREEIIDLRARNKKLTRQNFYYNAALARAEKHIRGIQARADRPLTPRPDWAELRRVLSVHVKPAVKETKVAEEGKPAGESASVANTSSVDRLSECVRAASELNSVVETLEKKAQLADVTRAWMGKEDLPAESMKSRQFRGQGTGPDVPRFLRWHGALINYRMSKGAVERLVKNVWALKTEPEYATAPISDVFYQYLLREAKGDEYKVAELAYNSIDALTRYRADGDCELFLLVLNGKVPEAVFEDQDEFLNQIREMFNELDTEGNGIVQRKAVRTQLSQVLRNFSMENLLRVRLGLELDQSEEENEVRWESLFDEDEDGNQGSFVEALRDCYMQEILDYQVDVAEAVRAAARAKGEKKAVPRKSRASPRSFMRLGSPRSNGSISEDVETVIVVSLSHIKEALHALDTEKPDEELNLYLARGMRMVSFEELCTKFGEELQHIQVTPEEFIADLTRGLLKRSGARTEEDERKARNIAEEQQQLDMRQQQEREQEDEM
eukprot:TRINITY_DN28486_c0_g1_i1.p1 TRINITY_DN28486_c0_g1~~TRINITY_DN28486_c0_g1_i1.p1  ORF type:complete len:865 (+),score=276.88 TRINITY_DN28486_c0_g1_i1:341-2596(+)